MRKKARNAEQAVRCLARQNEVVPSIQVDVSRGPRAAISAAATAIDNGSVDRTLLVEQLRVQAVMNSAKYSHDRCVCYLCFPLHRVPVDLYTGSLLE